MSKAVLRAALMAILDVMTDERVVGFVLVLAMLYGVGFMIANYF